MRSDQNERKTRPSGGLGWMGRLGLGLWLGALAFCLQFALASASELEPQAATMGWILTAILFVFGLAVWGALRVVDPRQPEEDSTAPRRPL